MDSPAPTPRSDLGVRTASGVVMMGVAAAAVWFGGWAFTAFVIAVGLGVVWEWWRLASRVAATPLSAAVWLALGVSYVAVGMMMLITLRAQSALLAVVPIILVIAVDVGAYFAGRTFGGPKIAPRISPSKTWAGLVGGAVAATLVMLFGLAPHIWTKFGPDIIEFAAPSAATGIFVAVIAQSGDFFESWMKRRAGVKDSGNLIPGHGGLFDRVDGLLAVLFAGGIAMVIAG
jgi:phosphatidate cytidylyltransferase